MESLHKVGLWEGDYEQPEQVRVMTSHNIGAGIQYKVQDDMCVQLRFKIFCASAQSGQSLSFPPEETLYPVLPIECPSKTLIGCADAQADLCLLWAHVSTCTLCWTSLHTVLFRLNLPTCLYHYNL